MESNRDSLTSQFGKKPSEPGMPASIEALCHFRQAEEATPNSSIIPESLFVEISKTLRTEAQSEEWANRPRTYFILWQIQRPDAMNAFIVLGLNDLSIPYQRRADLPPVLNFDEASQFIRWQASVRSDALDLERGVHVRIDDGNVLFESRRYQLGVGSQGRVRPATCLNYCRRPVLIRDTDDIHRTTVVDKVVSKVTGKVYARKRIDRRKKFGHEKHAQKTYENEIEALSKVAHDHHLIQVKGTYTDRKFLVMLLEPVADCNLKKFMDDWPQHSAEQKARFRTYFGCLAHTISFLHSPDVAIIHKDIKPENVLLKDGHLILTDFGTAYDYIWSLGVVFLEMITVLCGKTLTEMDKFLQKNGRCVSLIHVNLESAMNWLQTCESGSMIDNEPLAWIETMLNRVESNRPTAEQAYKGIAEFTDGEFCGRCCRNYDSDSDDDEDDKLSSVAEYEDAHRRSEFESPPSVLRGSSPHPESIPGIKNEVNEYLSPATAMRKESHAQSGSVSEPLAQGQWPQTTVPQLPTSYQTSVPTETFQVAAPPCQESFPSCEYSVGMKPPQQTDFSPTTMIQNEEYAQWSSESEPIAPWSQTTVSGPQDSYQTLVTANPPQGASLYGQGTAPYSTSRAPSPTSKKGPSKTKSKPFLERDKFRLWLASLPEKFASSSMHHRSIPARSHPSPPLHGPTVRTQMVKHYLSTLPGDAAEFEDTPEGFSGLEQLISPMKLPGRSKTMPISVDKINMPSRSQEDLLASSHPLHGEAEDEPFTEITKPNLFHYASDGDLNQAIQVSKSALQEATKDLKEFATTSPIFHRKPLLGASSTLSPTIHKQAKSCASKLEPVASVNANSVMTNLTAPQVHDLVDPIIPNDRAIENPAQNVGDRREREGVNSTQTPAPAKDSVADVPARLETFIKKARPQTLQRERRRKWESATVIMDRILDDKASVAPTSVMSANTRNKISNPRIITRWNDKAYGWLPSLVIDGKVRAVEQLLEAGCNPGTLEKERWAPVLNAIQGGSDRHNKCLNALIAYGANARAVRKSNGRTFLHYAIEQKPWPGYSSVIYSLLVAKANPNVKDKANNLPLLMLLDGSGPLPQEKRDALFLLLAPNFATDLEVKDPSTLDNPLHLAIRRKDAHTVDAILEKMKQIGGSALELMHERNCCGFTPILLGFSIFDLDKKSDEELHIIKLLLREGANPNDKDDIEGKTPLHLALCGSQNTIALELICRHSADPQIPDKSGQKAIDLVRKSRADHPENSWYAFAERRMMNELNDAHLRPPELEVFLAEEGEQPDQDILLFLTVFLRTEEDQKGYISSSLGRMSIERVHEILMAFSQEIGGRKHQKLLGLEDKLAKSKDSKDMVENLPHIDLQLHAVLFSFLSGILSFI